MENSVMPNLDFMDNPAASGEREFVEDKRGGFDDSGAFEKRQEKVLGFFKKNYNWAAYLVLAVIVYISVKIRTGNLSGLRDITTGTWTLGPDLDPFLFLRFAKYIVEHGALFGNDVMRYVPLGFDTTKEYLLHPYMLAWFHTYIGPLFGTESVTHSVVLYPVFMFALTVIAFFLFVRKVFANKMGEKNANVIALIASFFLTVMPPLLPRTIAGIPEKESAAFLFFFLALYFFISAWQGKSKKSQIFFSVLAGMATAGMAHVWGGYVFIFLTLSISVFFAFIFDKVDKRKFWVYATWLVVSFGLMYPLTIRFTLKDLLASLNTGPAVIVLAVMAVHFFVFNTGLKKYFSSAKFEKIPPQIISIILTMIALIIVSTIVFGLNFIPFQIEGVYNALFYTQSSRLIQTVAENRQPFFTEWVGQFGPYVQGIPLTFWLLFVGSIYLFYHMTKSFRKKERLILTLSYFVFLAGIVFSRYDGNSTLNGTNFTSIGFYLLGVIVFVGAIGYYYYQHYKNGEMGRLRKIDFSFILFLVFFLFGIIAARSAVRAMMMLVPPASAIVGYLAVASFNDAKKLKESYKRIIALILAVIVIVSVLFSGYGFYKISSGQAKGFVPSIYSQQWQKAMSWVRDNTQEDAVFGHWWDYGYWLQSMGGRATILDGGNSLTYWNHMMGRYALTGKDNREALEFLYAHDATHFLIDSTDIGKYSAFSSIGSDVSYDRRSFIPTFNIDEKSTQETKNSTIFAYGGGVGVDGDIVYDNDGTKVFIPEGKGGLGGVLIERDENGKIISQPIGVFVYQNVQYRIPFKYAYDQWELIEFDSGLEAGVYVFPSMSDTSGGVQMNPFGSLFYLSPKTVNSQLARLYLYKEDNPNFKLVLSQNDLAIEQIRNSSPGFNYEIVNYHGLRGPIRIWEINYPEDIEFKDEYLKTSYPAELKYVR